VEQGLTGSSVAGGGIPVQGEWVRVPEMVDEISMSSSSQGMRVVEHD
jgi:hypothetical protein